MKWPPPSNEKVPWSLKEEAATKKQILDQSEQIKSLQHQLEEAFQAIKNIQSQASGQDNEKPEKDKGQPEKDKQKEPDVEMKDDNMHSRRISLPVDLLREMEGDSSIGFVALTK